MVTRLKRYFQSRKGREALTFYAFVSPWLIGFFLLTIGMVVVGVLVTFTNYDGIMPLDQIRNVEFRNYERVLRDTKIPTVFMNTVRYVLLAVPLGIALQLGLALLLNRQNLHGKGVFRTLYYLPSILPLVAAVVIFQIIFDKNTGLMNAFLSIFQPGTAVNWQSSSLVLWVLIMLSIWTGLGSGMVIFLAGLQGVPTELKEAAMIDGANVSQVFRHVTMPLLSPVIFFQLVMGIIYSMQILMQPLLLSSSVTGYGGRQASIADQPLQTINMWANHAMFEIFGNGRYGYGVILLWMMFLVVIFLSVLLFGSSRYWVYYEVEQ